MMNMHRSKTGTLAAASGSSTASPSLARQIRCSVAAEGSKCKATIDRRLLISALISTSSLLTVASPSQARYESSLCSYKDSEAESDECRAKTLSDASSLSYSSERKGFGAVGGVPVAVLDEVYAKSSLALMDEIESYLALDPKDGKARFTASKRLKNNGLDWVSKYARGGSARSQSARKLYIAIDGLLGFLASNGIGAVPKAKVQATLATVEDARKLLAEAK